MDNKEKIVKLLNIKYDTYKEILERNYELKFKNYFEKYENSLDAIKARERLNKSKLKNRELFEEFLEVIRYVDYNSIDKKERNELIRQYEDKFGENIKEINKNQYIIFNEFLIKHEKVKSDKNCKYVR